MDKLLLFPGKSEKGIFTFVIDQEHSHLVKTAAEYHPEIAVYINSAKPIPGKTQILLTALGAGEWWGCNVNGDYFPEMALSNASPEFGHKTFESTAKIYKHHVNKDPTASYGDVALAVYNHKYHRVELIVVLDNAKAPDIAARIEEGDYPEWSMGCRVPYDVCSICGNKAPTRAQYCEHLKYYMGRIHPGSGKMAYAINTVPKFFDISQVLIGADKIAKTLRKVASSSAAAQVMSSAYLAEKMAETDKAAEIEKEIPADQPPASQEAIDTFVRAIPELKSREAPLPREVLDRLATRPLSDVFSTLAAMHILPKPQEIQRIILVASGRRDAADSLDDRGLCFDPMMVQEPTPLARKVIVISSDRFNEGIVDDLRSHAPERSYFYPHLMRRMFTKHGSAEYIPTFIKSAEDIKDERKPLDLWKLLLLAAGVHALINHEGAAKAVGWGDKLMQKSPGLTAALLGGGALVMNKMMGTTTKGQYDAGGMPANPDMNNTLDMVERKRQNAMLKMGFDLNIGPAFKRMAVIPTALYGMSGILQKHREANPHDQESRFGYYVRKYPDLLSAMAVVDGMMAIRGKGTHRVTKHIGPLFSKMTGAAKSTATSALERNPAIMSKVGSENDTLECGYWKRAQEFAEEILGEQSPIKTASALDVATNLAVGGMFWPLMMGGKGLPGRVVGGVLDQLAFEGSGHLMKKVLSNKNNPNRIESIDRRI